MKTIEFRKSLKTRMAEEGLNQSDLAKRYAVTQSAISRFLNDERGISGRHLLALLPFVFPDKFNGKSHATK